MKGFKATKERSGSEAYELYVSKTDDFKVHVDKNYGLTNCIEWGSVTVYKGEETVGEWSLRTHYLKDAKLNAFSLIEKLRSA